jgi:hypothetical protein
MTLVVRTCDLGWINGNKFNELSPSKGNGIELHIKHKCFAFNVFLLPTKYYNNASFNLVMDFTTDSNDLHFMVQLMHNVRTHHKQTNTKHNNTIMHKCKTQHKHNTINHNSKQKHNTKL